MICCSNIDSGLHTRPSGAGLACYKARLCSRPLAVGSARLVICPEDAWGGRRGGIHDAINGEAGAALGSVGACPVACSAGEASCAVGGVAAVVAHGREAGHLRRGRPWGRGPVTRLVACAAFWFA